jgi:phenylacetate-CoA ligase
MNARSTARTLSAEDIIVEIIDTDGTVVVLDGTVMHGLALIYILRDLPEITSFKIVQESRVRVLVVPVKPLTVAVRDAIDEGLCARLGQAVTVEIEEVSEIAGKRSGKFRYVVSNVGVNAAG